MQIAPVTGRRAVGRPPDGHGRDRHEDRREPAGARREHSRPENTRDSS